MKDIPDNTVDANNYLEDQMEKVELRSVKNGIRIYGLPESNEPDSRKLVLNKVLKTRSKLGCRLYRRSLSDWEKCGK